MKDNEFQQSYPVAIKNKFELLTRESQEKTPDELWEDVKNIVQAAAKDTLQKRNAKKKPWIKDETFKLIEEKRLLRMLMVKDMLS